MAEPRPLLAIALDAATDALAIRQNEIVAKDRRIAELEASLKEVDKWYTTEHIKVKDPSIVDKTPTLDALLAQAKSEALEDAAKWFDRPGWESSHTEVARQLRRMAREVKP